MIAARVADSQPSDLLDSDSQPSDLLDSDSHSLEFRSDDQSRGLDPGRSKSIDLNPNRNRSAVSDPNENENENTNESDWFIETVDRSANSTKSSSNDSPPRTGEDSPQLAATNGTATGGGRVSIIILRLGIVYDYL
jgi:hypothetical protein